MSFRPVTSLISNYFYTSTEPSDSDSAGPSQQKSVWRRVFEVASSIQNPYEPFGSLPQDLSVSDVANQCSGSWAAKKVQQSEWFRHKAKTWIIGKEDYSGPIQKYKDQINALMHHPHASCFLEALMPKITSLITKQLTKKAPAIEHFVRFEKGYIEQIIESILYKMIRNFSRHAINHSLENEEDNVALLVIERLLEWSFDEFDKVDKNLFLTTYYGDEENGDQEIILREMMQPMAGRLLEIMLPGGQKDLKIGNTVGNIVWETLATTVIPDILVDAYALATCPTFGEGLPALSQEKEGYGFLNVMTTLISRNCDKLGYKIIERNKSALAEKFTEMMGIKGEAAKSLEGWMIVVLDKLSKSRSSGMTRLSGSIIINVEALLRHIFDNAGASEEGDNAIAVVVHKAIGILYRFFGENQAYIDHEMERLKECPDKKKIKKVMVPLFRPLCNELLDAANLTNNKIIAFLNEELFPFLLYEFYRDMILYEANFGVSKNQLQRRLFDGQQLLRGSSMQLHNNYAQVVNSLNHSVNGEEIFWRQAGVTDVVQRVENACGDIALDVRLVIEKYIKVHSDKLAGYINLHLPRDLRLSEEDEFELMEGIDAYAKNESHNEIEPTLNYCQSLLRLMFFKFLSALAHKTENGDVVAVEDNRNSLIASALIKKIFSVFNDHFTEIPEQLKQLDEEGVDEEEYDERIRNIFSPLSSDLLNLVGNDWKDIIPAPDLVKEVLEGFIAERALPALIYDIYKQTHSWVAQENVLEEQLDATFNSESPKKTVNSVSQYVEDFIPYCLEVQPCLVVKEIESFGEKYLSHMTIPQRNKLRTILRENIKQVGSDTTNAVAWKVSGTYVKSIVLKMLSCISKEIELNERVRGLNGESTFLLKSVVNVMNVTKDHFVTISKIPEKNRLSPAHRVPHEKMLEGFINEGIIHPALKDDLTASEVERKKNRLEHFYQPLANHIIELAGIESSKDFPVPGLLRDDAWDLFKNEAMPSLLMNIFNTFLEPRHINKLLLNTIDYLNSEIEGIENEHYIENDAHQRELNEASGEIIKSMISLIPQIFSKTVIHADKLKEMTAEELGGLVRRKLQKTSMIELLDSLCEKSTIPDPKDERWKDPLAQAKHDKKVERELKKKMTMYISEQVKVKVRASMKQKWKSFQKDFDRVVEKCLGKVGAAVKVVLDNIFHFIFFTVLGPLLDFVFFNILWFFVDIIISRKSVEIIRDSQMKIHENLIFNIVEIWVNLMLDAKRKRLEESEGAAEDEVSPAVAMDTSS